MSAEVLQSLSSSVGSMVQPQSWTAVTGNSPLDSTFLTDSACPASLLPHPHVETFWVLKAGQGLMLYSM